MTWTSILKDKGLFANVLAVAALEPAMLACTQSCKMIL